MLSSPHMSSSHHHPLSQDRLSHMAPRSAWSTLRGVRHAHVGTAARRDAMDAGCSNNLGGDLSTVAPSYSSPSDRVSTTMSKSGSGEDGTALRTSLKVGCMDVSDLPN